MTDPRSPIAALRSGTGRILREAALLPAALRGRLSGRHPRLAVLPSSSREASSLLRGYNIAEALGPLGWQSIVVPQHLALGQRNRLLRLFRPDIVLVQKTRHPLNQARFLRDWRLVLDLDDADFLDPKMTSLTEIRAVAAGVICGSRYIADWARARADLPTRVIWTGNEIAPGPWPDHAARAPIVTWAQSDPVAYASVLERVIDICLRAAADPAAGPAAGARPFTLRLYNWTADPADPRLERLRAAGIAVELMPKMPYERFMLSLRDAAIGLSPLVFDGEKDFNRGKSFGKILGYLDAKVPVICSDAADHADFFTPETGIVSNDPDLWARSIVTLLADPDRRRAMSEAAHLRYREQLSLAAAAAQTDNFLRSLLPAA